MSGLGSSNELLCVGKPHGISPTDANVVTFASESNRRGQADTATTTGDRANLRTLVHGASRVLPLVVQFRGKKRMQIFGVDFGFTSGSVVQSTLLQPHFKVIDQIE